MSKIFFYIAALALLLSGCQARESEVVILSLNDIHAKIDHLDKVAAYVSEERAKNPNVLLLSAGDLFSGNPVVDYFSEKGFPIVDIMNDMQLDASAVGNHELDYGQNVLAKRMAQANFPFVCANMRTDSSCLPALEPYIFFTKTGEKICVVGLTQERPETLEKNLKMLQFFNPSEELKKHIALRKKSDLLIALTHVGVAQDSLLALRCGELDLIVGGHSHTRLDTGMLVNGVLITQAERYAKYIGKTVVRFRNGKVASKRNHLVNMAQLTQKDTLISRKIEQYNNNPELKQVVGVLKKSIAGAFNIGNFFCDAVRAQSKADIVFQNRYGVRADSFPQGEITKRELYNADPFGNKIVQVEMTGKEVLQFIANVYNRFQRLDLCVSGIGYKVMVKNGSAGSVQAFLPNGKPLDERKKYSVAMNSYMYTKTDDYPLPQGSSGTELSMNTVEATEQYMRGQKIIDFGSPTRAEENAYN